MTTPWALTIDGSSMSSGVATGRQAIPGRDFSSEMWTLMGVIVVGSWVGAVLSNGMVDFGGGAVKEVKGSGR